jgi:hypothetical protein
MRFLTQFRSRDQFPAFARPRGLYAPIRQFRFLRGSAIISFIHLEHSPCRRFIVAGCPALLLLKDSFSFYVYSLCLGRFERDATIILRFIDGHPSAVEVSDLLERGGQSNS